MRLCYVRDVKPLDNGGLRFDVKFAGVATIKRLYKGPLGDVITPNAGRIIIEKLHEGKWIDVTFKFAEQSANVAGQVLLERTERRSESVQPPFELDFKQLSNVKLYTSEATRYSEEEAKKLMSKYDDAKSQLLGSIWLNIQYGDIRLRYSYNIKYSKTIGVFAVAPGSMWNDRWYESISSGVWDGQEWNGILRTIALVHWLAKTNSDLGIRLPQYPSCSRCWHLEYRQDTSRAIEDFVKCKYFCRLNEKYIDDDVVRMLNKSVRFISHTTPSGKRANEKYSIQLTGNDSLTDGFSDGRESIIINYQQRFSNPSMIHRSACWESACEYYAGKRGDLALSALEVDYECLQDRMKIENGIASVSANTFGNDAALSIRLSDIEPKDDLDESSRRRKISFAVTYQE